MKKYTISTLEFKLLKEAERKIEYWIEKEKFNWDGRVFEIKGVYKPRIKLEKQI